MMNIKTKILAGLACICLILTVFSGLAKKKMPIVPTSSGKWKT